MGYYVNPRGESKEQWLKANGVLINPDTALSNFNYNSTCLPVCLVDNGLFTAAGICYSPEETATFNRPDDERPKDWYLVPKVALKPWYDKE